MNKYMKFYVKLFFAVFVTMIISYTLSFIFFYYFFFIDDEYVNNLEYFFYMGIVLIFVASFLTIIFVINSFRIIRNDLEDSKWAIVKYSNIQLKLSRVRAYKKCVSCISSLNWSILEEINIPGTIQDIKRIIGVTKFGLTIFYEIFIIDISEINDTTTSVHCSVRPLSITYIIGKRRCIKQLKKLKRCIGKQKMKLYTPSRLEHVEAHKLTQVQRRSVSRESKRR